jgi:AcrR family transcriptional regulator
MATVGKRQRAKQERRDEILAASVRVFLDRGVAGATMDDIARQAGVSKGTLYLYFDSKDALFLTIAIEWLKGLLSETRLLADRHHENGLELLRAGAKIYITHALSCRARYQVAMSWFNSTYTVDGSTELFEEYRGSVAECFTFATGAIDRAKADGSLDAAQPTPRLAMQLWGSMVGLIFLEHNSEEMARRLPAAPPVDGICEDFINLFLASAGARVARSRSFLSLPSTQDPRS